jgi:hypothetical protein
VNISSALQQRFIDLLTCHGINIRGSRFTVRCIFHPDGTPSLSINVERGLFYCFGCGVGGGIRDFSRAVGEQWGVPRHSPRDHTHFAVQARRRRAEEQSRTILRRRQDERENQIWQEWGEASTEATHAAELLTLFFRRPDLAEEFPRLVSITESEYSAALFQKMVLETQWSKEIG